MVYTVLLTSEARKMLHGVRDTRVQDLLRERMRDLREDPGLKGKSLSGDLAGFRSVRAVGQRYRIIYKIQAQRVIVHIVAVGIRKTGSKSDIYEMARRLFRLGLLE